MRKFFWVLIFLFHLSAYSAENNDSVSRPITSTYSVEVGGESVLMEYLSPLAYRGTNYALSGSWEKMMPWQRQNAMMGFYARAYTTRLINPAHTAASFGIGASFRWQMRWLKRLPHNLTLTLGGGIGLQGAGTALLRNSNNPVNIEIQAALEGGASLSWRSHIGRLPILLEERLSTPVLGAFYMPGYGETYYEIWVGHRSGLAHCGWWGNMPGIDNHLSISLDFGKTAMQIGYHFTAEGQFANNLANRRILHAITIGVIPHGLGIKPIVKTNTD